MAHCASCDSYNICNIGYVVQLIRLEHPVPRWAAPAFSSSCLFGAVVGQLVLGWCGDKFGRKTGLTLCLLLTVAGSLGSAVFTQGYSLDFRSMHSILQSTHLEESNKSVIHVRTTRTLKKLHFCHRQ